MLAKTYCWINIAIIVCGGGTGQVFAEHQVHIHDAVTAASRLELDFVKSCVGEQNAPIQVTVK